MTLPDGGGARLRRPLLLFGATGQVGRALLAPLASIGTLVAPPRTEADLSRPESLRDVIRITRPAVIVNAAAVTNVDRAEREPDLARAINEEAPGAIAVAGAEVGALVVHYSTDYVFDGQAQAPYAEDASPNPINAYGASKLAGERAVAAADSPHVIIRTSWVYSAAGAGFVATLLGQLRAGQTPIRVVADQVGSPTWSRSLARATAALVGSIVSGDTIDLPRADWGVYHLGGSGAASRLEIAREVIARVSAGRTDRTGGDGPVLIPVSAAEFGAVAKRPRFSALSNARTRRRFGVDLPEWRHDLAAMLLGGDSSVSEQFLRP